MIVDFNKVSCVNIEPTNFCPLKCSCCGDDKTRPLGIIVPSLFDRLASQCKGKEHRLFNSGEPLTHPDICQLVGIARKYTDKVVIHTNAVVLTRSLASDLVESGLTHLSISFDGIGKDEYESNRVGAKFERVVENIKTFLEINQSSGRKIKVTIQRIVKLGQPMLNLSKLFPGADEYPVITRHSWDIKDKVEGHRPETIYEMPCFFLWNYMAVLWDGRVVSCCADLNGRCIIGDANKDTLPDIWNGQIMTSIRQRMLDRKPIPEICSGCERYYGRDIG